jgi:hypothetical protein
MSGQQIMDCNDRSVVDTVDYPEIQMISDEAQRIIDEQGNVLKPVEDSDSARCDNCLKSEAELASGVILKRCKDCGIALYCVRTRLPFNTHTRLIFRAENASEKHGHRTNLCVKSMS